MGSLDTPDNGEASRLKKEQSVGVDSVGEISQKDESFDLMSLPAPLEHPEDFTEDALGDEEDEVVDDALTEVDAELPPWDIVFLPGEEPRLVVRAALVLEDGVEDASLVESSVPLTEEDVDRLLKLALKVEKFHSVKSKMGRRIIAWAMRRKFFAGVTAFILLFLGVMTVINIFR